MIARLVPKPVFASIALTLAFFLVATPVAAYASTGIGRDQQSATEPPPSPREPCADAELQADSDTNGTVWMVGGCLATVLTLIAAQVLEPEPPAAALLGQSPEYVAVYTDCYKRAAKKKRTNKALTGCLIGGAAWAALYLLVVAVAVSDPNPSYY